MAGKKYEKSYFDVLGLCCTSEVALVENILKSLDGVKDFSVVVPTKTLIVVHDHLLLSQLQIVKALNQARLEANVRMKGEGGKGYKKKWPSPFAMASGILFAISVFKCLYRPLEWLALAAAAVGIIPILFKAYASVKHCRLDTSILLLIAVGGTIAIHDFLEAAAIVFLYSIGDWLESMAGHKANAAMSALMRIAPQRAVIAETGEEVDADQVKINTTLAVKAGETIPIDGIVVDGNCEVDEKAFTGESHPVLKQVDSTVWAGTINLNGYISVKTTAVAEDCMVAKMAKLVEEAQSSQSKAQRFVDKCAQYYTPAIVIIAAGLAIIPIAMRLENRNHWIHIALVFLVSGCPCALILSTPVATFCALTKAATNGVLIKGGDHLENLAKIKVLGFDKTGTLTRGDFVVSDFHSLSIDISLHELLYWVSSMESKSSHPMAEALVDHAKSLSIDPNPANVMDFQNFPGEGISGIIDGKQIFIGNKKIGTRAGFTATVPMLEIDETKGKSVGYVYCEANPIGIFSLSDVCRTGAQEAISNLKSLHIKTAMLTGDTHASAMHIQQQLGNALDVVQSHLLPEEKSAIIKEFKKEGITAMVGDGVNDAPALATADIGISMGISGSALATETGHVILMSNDIRKVPQTIKLARKTHRKVVQNVFFSIATKAAVLALAFLGHPLVWAAVLADVGTCLLVIFNSMLLLHSSHKHGAKGGKCCTKRVAKSIECCSMSSKTCNSRDLEANHSSHSRDHDHKEVRSKKGGHCHSKHGTNVEHVKDCCNSRDLEANNFNTHCITDHSSHSLDHDHKEVGSKKGGHCHSKHCGSLTAPGRPKHCHSKHCHDDDHHKNHVEHVKDRCNSRDLEANNPHTHCNTNHSNHSHDHEHKEVGAKKATHCHSKQCHGDDDDDVGSLKNVELGFDHHHHRVEKMCCDGNNSNPNCSTQNDIHEDVSSSCSIDYETKTATISEKREMRSCCKTYLKHCCNKHGQFATGFGGGLCEIITE